MRGALALTTRRRVISRIIPADAGSTMWETAAMPGFVDHPRGCGEHHQRGQGQRAQRGSSPRMRGAPQVQARVVDPGGIIPADAGSTCVSSDHICLPEDHPRGCGEHGSMCMREYLNTGSSPRMRGAPRIDRVRRTDAGIIPADAGSTPRPTKARSGAQDHPRGCGEHQSMDIPEH